MAEKSGPQLEATKRAAEYQRTSFAELRREVFDEHKPYAIVQADMPIELFTVMGLRVISNQWWAAIVSSKKLSANYLDGLNALGYHQGLCRYCSLSFASSVCATPENAPWGGLPRPALLGARLTCDCIQRVFYNWAQFFQTRFVALDNTGSRMMPPRWWTLSRYRWEEMYETDRLDHMVAEFQPLIASISEITGNAFDTDTLRNTMEMVNRQEEYFEEVRDLICTAPQTPVRMREQVNNVMTCQWHRGTEWAIDHARNFRDEVKERVEKGIAAYPEERIRLMWIGAGIWHDLDFYTAFEEDYKAVFAWSMYLAFGPDGYIRYGLEDPLRALASRTVSMNEQLHNPPWVNEWMLEQARMHRIDAAVMLMPLGTRPSATGTIFTERMLEEAGVPVITLASDMADARAWDGAAMRAIVGNFLKARVVKL